jgi:hypothetical protein
MASGAMTAGIKAMMGRRRRDTFDERLMALFRNRAALKKSYNELRSSHDSLREKMLNAEAATRRAEERLETIEQLMAQPGSGYNGIVYFKLRLLWRACNEQLGHFATELARQQEERERHRLIQRFQQDRDRRLQDLGDLIRKVKAEADRLSERLEQKRAELKAATGLFAWFRRRELRGEVGDAEREHATLRKRIEELFDRRIRIEGEAWPEYEGLDVEGRRAINVAVIAYAHHLCAYFSDLDLATRAREAMTMPIQDIKYGTEADCARLISRIEHLLEGLRDQRRSATHLKEYAAEIRLVAKYRNELETVPQASSLSRLDLSASRGAPMPRVDVMRDEYWDIYDVFLR